MSFGLISRGDKLNVIILSGIIKLSRYPQKPDSSEAEGSWVKTGGLKELGELLGHQETGESFGDLAQIAAGGSCITLGFS